MKKIITLLSIIYLTACAAQKIDYNPNSYLNLETSIATLEKAFNQQPPNHHVVYSEIKSDHFLVISGEKQRRYVVFFKFIGDITLHEKDEWKISSIWDHEGNLIYRFYMKDEQLAKKIIDAVSTLKKNYLDKS